MKTEPFQKLVHTCCASVLLAMTLSTTTHAQEQHVSLSARDTEIADVLGMLSKRERVNILLSSEVRGTVSLNIFDTPLDEAIESIANAGGYAVEKRGDSYFVLRHEDAGRYKADGLTAVRTFDLRYVDPEAVRDMLRPYLSGYGELSVDLARKLLMVEDTPEFIDRISNLLAEMDALPHQILFEARILEIELTEEDAFGIDWSRLFESAQGIVGQQGLAGAGGSNTTGFFADFVGPEFEAHLDALHARGRLRTLSTPRLVALENMEAEVIVGDRTGYAVTTTINQVTTESIEFLDSGVILRVVGTIDNNGQILLDIHPEVSSASVDANGIPSLSTTEVTTRMLVPNGATIFIGGLIRNIMLETRKGVPVLGDIPGLRKIFSNKLVTQLNTETIVLITPTIVDTNVGDPWNTDPIQRTDGEEQKLDIEGDKLERDIERNQRGINPATQQTTMTTPAQEPLAKTALDPAPAVTLPLDPDTDLSHPTAAGPSTARRLPIDARTLP